MKIRAFRLPILLGLALTLAAILLIAMPVSTEAATRPIERPDVISPAWSSCVYRVQYGDDLFRISMRYNMPVYAMMAYNGLYRSYLIYSGMMLRVPCAPAYSSSLFYQPPSYTNYGQPANGNYQPPAYSNYGTNGICAVHVVQFGEDLFRIALRYGMSWPNLAAANHLANPNVIFAGMRLVIPCSAGGNPYAPQSNAYGQSQNMPPMNPYSQPSTSNPAPTAMPGQSTNVTIQDFMFTPATITIHMGQTVIWKNNGPSAHTVTSNTGVWDSGTLNPGASFSHTFGTTGTFPYHCSIHPMMMGTVVVVP